MKKTFALVAASLSAGAVLLAVPKEAHAIGPVDVEVAARVGYASNPSNVSGSSDGLGFGAGVRGGVSFFGIYAGLSFMYYAGASESETLPTGTGTSGSLSVSTSAILYGIDLGYSFKLPMFITIRPQVGFGNATAMVSVNNVSSSNNNSYVEPGVLLQARFGTFIAGVDANALFFPGQNDSQAAFTIHGQLGLAF
jgi:hypothetical protein